MTTDLLLTRAVGLPFGGVDLPLGMGLHRVTQVSDAGFGLLDQMYGGAGFPAGWPGQMIERGAIGVVISSGAQSAGAAFLVRKPFYIEELRRTFDAGVEGDYYFGDFVPPTFRGQGLQRALIRARLAITREAGRRWAMALTRATIPASLANYRAEGFDVAMELRKRKFLHWELEQQRRGEAVSPSGKFSEEGVRLPLGWRVRRCK